MLTQGSGHDNFNSYGDLVHHMSQLSIVGATLRAYRKAKLEAIPKWSLLRMPYEMVTASKLLLRWLRIMALQLLDV